MSEVYRVLTTAAAHVILAVHLLGQGPILPIRTLANRHNGTAVSEMKTTEWSEQDLTSCILKGGSLEATATRGSGMAATINANPSSLKQTLTQNSATGNAASSRDPEAGYFCQLKVKVGRGGQVKVTFPGLSRSFCGVGSPNSRSAVNTIQALSGCEEAETTVGLAPADNSSEWFELRVMVRWNSSRVSDEGGDDLLTMSVTGALEAHCESSLKGYLQSRDAARTSSQPWARVSVPPGHNLMVSLGRRAQYSRQPFSCDYHDRIRIYVHGNFSRPWSLSCERDAPLPLLFEDEEAVYFDYPSTRYAGRRSWVAAIRVLFSFLPKSPGMKQLTGGMWNCSGEGWEEARRHFPCNLQRECEGGEDEEGCPYTGACGAGRISLSSRCYVFVGHGAGQSLRTWQESEHACREQGGALASLNTPQEWRAVTELLQESMHSSETFLGLRKLSHKLPRMYGKTYSWSDGTMAHWVVLTLKLARGQSQAVSHTPSAFAFSKTHLATGWSSTFRPLTDLGLNARRPSLCEVTSPDNVSLGTSSFSYSSLPGHSAVKQLTPVVPSSMAQCPEGHITHTTYACDDHCYGDGTRFENPRSHPAPRSSSSSSSSSHPSYHPASKTSDFCRSPSHPHPPKWKCGCGGGWLAYAELCDGRADCPDNSDEEFCVYPPCHQFMCTTGHHCLPHTAVCDHHVDCLDGSDEEHCGGHVGGNYSVFSPTSNNTELIVRMDSQGVLRPHPLMSRLCPETHFQCPSNPALCLPVFLVCNGVQDCPSGVDEADCYTYTCTGYYRCRRSKNCVHMTSLCDGVFQCPLGDDERGCDAVCPRDCICFDLIYSCAAPVQLDKTSPPLRYLDASNSGTSLSALAKGNIAMLYHLNLAYCPVFRMEPLPMPNLYLLDLSFTRVRSLDPRILQQFRNLRVLSLANTPLVLAYPPSSDPSSWRRLPIHTLDLSGTQTRELGDDDLYNLGITELQVLNLSFTPVWRIGQALQKLPALQTLDTTGCPLHEFPRDIFEGLDMLEYVFTGNYKLCCPVTLPHTFNQLNCYAPMDEISSCEALLRSNLNRFFLYLYMLFAIAGNLGSLIYRFCQRRRRESNLSGNTFVSHLCVSDLLMGVYLLLIGVADYCYRGNYVYNDDNWRHSSMCLAAGFIAFLSCEVSALVICLITLDCLVTLRWPLSKLRFKAWSTHLACLVVWLIGLGLAGIPLLPMMKDWDFYSQTGVCIPLPITRMYFRGHMYSFCVLIILNFLLFLIIAPGQVLIYREVRRHQKANKNSPSENTALASRLFTIAMTDFLCWFPVGCLGLMAAQGMPVPGEFNVVTVIFVLPVNSALNPFIYTLGMYMEQQRRRRKPCKCGQADTQAETNVDDAQPGYIRPTLDMA